MSKVKIQGNVSGTGIFTVAAPATNSDRTLTLPDTDGTIVTSANLTRVFINDGDLYNFSGTITFTNAGATGRMGPSLADCRSSYTAEAYQSTWLNDTSLFYVEQGAQYWVVPKTGNYEIETAGAGRTRTYDGRGAIIKSTHTLYAGELLRIIVGQQGIQLGSTYPTNTGGHGGSAVSVYRRIGNNLLHILLSLGGGGSGVTGNSLQSTQAVRDGSYSNSGIPEGGFGSVWQLAYATNSGLVNFWPGGGGGGWLRKGATGGIGDSTSKKDNSGGALAFDALGGFHENGLHGGFGGGGASGRDTGAGGGGGGYNGGHALSYSGGQANDIETGGGSYTAPGITQTNVGYRTGQGYVKVTL